MKTSLSRNLVLVGACLLGAVSANAANLVANGDFETPVGETCFLSGTTVGSWTSLGNLGSCYVPSSFQSGLFPVAYSGNQMMYVNNAHSIATTISQSLGLSAGQAYDLSFAMSGLGDGVSAPSLKIFIAGQSMNFTSPIGKTWALEDWIFTPTTSGTTALQFSALTSAGVVIDAVSLTTVSAVPEPQVLSLMIGGLAIVGALARRRSKNTQV